LKKLKEDPAYNINLSGDTKAMLRELGTEKAKEISMLGGGGGKAQQERGAALSVLDKARERLANQSKGTESLGLSIVDAASASVYGRSAAAAKAAPQDKTAARVAAHFAGEMKAVNAKMVCHK
jgi:peptidyl-prolyl cis-trans isomerase-like protein 2